MNRWQYTMTMNFAEALRCQVVATVLYCAQHMTTHFDVSSVSAGLKYHPYIHRQCHHFAACPGPLALGKAVPCNSLTGGETSMPIKLTLQCRLSDKTRLGSIVRPPFIVTDASKQSLRTGALEVSFMHQSHFTAQHINPRYTCVLTIVVFVHSPEKRPGSSIGSPSFRKIPLPHWAYIYSSFS